MGEVYNAPQPSVTHIVSIFRQIGSGEIQIPAFQRGFVWNEKQIIDLLGSVYESYPIGSILLWSVTSTQSRLSTTTELPFPKDIDRFPTNYVLDGMQRLSTLYGVFNFGKTTQNTIFEVAFDLKNKEFVHVKDVKFGLLDLPPHFVRLSVLFDPKALISAQSQLVKQENADELIDSLIDLQAKFQEYMIPVVKISDENINRVVRVFEKINSAGTPLDALDFMRAITWAKDFDLSDRLMQASEKLGEFGFYLDEETIVKCVAIYLEIQPTAEGLLSLRGYDPDILKSAFTEVEDRIIVVIRFLREYLDIQSSDLVAYEGQFLILFKAITMDGADEYFQHQLAAWFLLSSLNESLRGRPDHYVARAVGDWRGMLQGRIRGFDAKLRLAKEDFSDRKLLKGRALSSGFLCVYASMEPLDLRSERSLKGRLASWDQAAGVAKPIYKSIGRKNDVTQSRVIANMIAIEGTDWEVGDVRSEIIKVADGGRYDILIGHFINEDAMMALRENDVSMFLHHRSLEIFKRSTELIAKLSKD